jgi:broad specificity polyphosphatase/5'/3'-nucleotidase SurE
MFIKVCSGQGSRVSRRITSGANRAAVCQGIASPSMKCWLSAIADNLSERLDPRGRPYYWIGPVREDGFAQPGTDLAAINEKQVSVTPIYLNLTNVPVLASLKKVFG